MHALAIFFFPFSNLLLPLPLPLLLPHSLLKHPTDSGRQLEFNRQAPSTIRRTSTDHRRFAFRRRKQVSDGR